MVSTGEMPSIGTPREPHHCEVVVQGLVLPFVRSTVLNILDLHRMRVAVHSLCLRFL